MLDIKINAIQLRMDESDLKFSFCKGETEWSWTKDYRPKMECKEGTVFFDEALEISSFTNQMNSMRSNPSEKTLRIW